MGSSATGEPPPSDKIRLYHLTTQEHAISNIALRRIKVARFYDLNDPFELLALNFKYGHVRKVVKEFKTAFDSAHGMLCFTADWTSPVMWSHYAMKHRGICLGFDLPKTLVQKVEYEDKRLLETLGESKDPYGLSNELQNLLMRTKSKQWNYEEEYRMFVPLAEAIQQGNLYFKPLGNDITLVEVILGPNCEIALDEVRKLTERNKYDAKVFKSRLAWKHFKVVPYESTVP